MKNIPVKSYIKVIKCASKQHTNHTGHIISKRLHAGYNVKLTNHENCVALKVELLIKAYKPRRQMIEQKPTNWWSWIGGLI